MAIFSLNHRTVGRTTHAPRTASFNARYITREEACTKVLGARMPTEREALYAWLDAQEDGDRQNARVIDKVMVALPIELTHAQRAELVRSFAESMTDGRASWADALHDGPSDADNPHAHIIFRDRDYQTGKRVMKLSEKGSTERLRAAWEYHANFALERAGVDARIDRRSLAAQGIAREAQIHVGPAIRVLSERGERPSSTARTVNRIIDGELKPIVVDYPSIDRGKTRLEENTERLRRNAGIRPADQPTIHWTGRGGMVAEQRSAMKWIKSAHKREQLRREATSKHTGKGNSPREITAAAAERHAARLARRQRFKSTTASNKSRETGKDGGREP